MYERCGFPGRDEPLSDDQAVMPHPMPRPGNAITIAGQTPRTLADAIVPRPALTQSERSRRAAAIGVMQARLIAALQGVRALSYDTPIADLELNSQPGSVCEPAEAAFTFNEDLSNSRLPRRDRGLAGPPPSGATGSPGMAR